MLTVIIVQLLNLLLPILTVLKLVVYLPATMVHLALLPRAVDLLLPATLLPMISQLVAQPLNLRLAAVP